MPKTRSLLICSATVTLLASCGLAQERLHFTYLWHLEQPIYWPERQVSGTDRYQRAWETIQVRDSGAAHPQDDLRGIFGLDDRKAVYQYRVKDCISAISGAPEAGAQITYSGGLIENIMSLGGANQLGYGPFWYNDFRTARSWNTSTTSSNKPRLDVVLFSFHHALLPLLDDAAVRKEIQAYKRIYADAWGSTVAQSRGFFPSEMAFSMRLIPSLAAEGINWTFVSSEKLSRACADFPVIYGSGGVNCDPPNAADQLNPAAGTYYRQTISRGCSPAEAVPFAYTPHRARYIDPATGASSEVIVIGCSQHMGWKDGYAPLGLADFNAVDAIARPSRPMLAVLAHDGDNAWGGGFSYYLEATPNLVSSARSAGYTPTVVEKYLADHPVPANDYVHVEQGAWVNADGDFGAPQFLNWNWPLLDASGGIDIPNGWHEDARNWAVITANTNRVVTAEQIHTDLGGSVNISKVVYPDGATNNAERAWHYFLGGLNSGFMYYGTALDMEVKPTVSGNRAMIYADQVIGNASADRTPPTIWTPQRHPWNPGSTNFGPQYGYRQSQSNGDFSIYTFAYDVSGMQSVTLKYRLDNDGVNAGADTQNETYAGGAGVGAWQSIPMTARAFPAGNVYNNGGLDFYVMPQYIATQYTAQVTGIRSKLVDYYIEAVDVRGNIKKSSIDHVYVGNGAGGGGGTPGASVTFVPATPIAGQDVTITYDPAGRVLAGAASVRLHYGFNNWANVVSPDPAMTLANSKWSITVPVAATATQLDVVFNNGASTWDNNGGADWHVSVQAGSPPPPPPWVMDGIRDTDSVLVAQNGMRLWAGLKGSLLYVATEDAGEGNDHFILIAANPAAARPAMWAKAGTVAGWDAFLADENTNDYEGWFDISNAAANQAMTGANGGVLEGTINLAQELGVATLPEFIYLAVAPYGNADGGALVSAFQVPASVNGNGHLDAAEYIRVPLCALTAAGCLPPPPCPADFNEDGGVDGADVGAFFEAWEQGEAAADINQDGGVDGSDVAAFFGFWELGGC